MLIVVVAVAIEAIVVVAVVVTVVVVAVVIITIPVLPLLQLLQQMIRVVVVVVVVAVAAVVVVVVVAVVLLEGSSLQVLLPFSRVLWTIHRIKNKIKLTVIVIGNYTHAHKNKKYMQTLKYTYAYIFCTYIVLHYYFAKFRNNLRSFATFCAVSQHAFKN
jgi:uncharacterized membrane protein